MLTSSKIRKLSRYLRFRVHKIDKRSIKVQVPWSPEILLAIYSSDRSRLAAILTRRANVLYVLARELSDGQQEIARVEVAMGNCVAV